MYVMGFALTLFSILALDKLFGQAFSINILKQ